MIRNLKALGLVAVAALAISAMFASAAQAQAGTFTAGKTPDNPTTTAIAGSQYGLTTANQFTMHNGAVAVHCQIATFAGSVPSGTATSLTIIPAYKDCLANGQPATVTMNKCDYIFNQPHTKAGGGEPYTGTVSMTCPNAGERIEIHVYAFGSMTSHTFGACTVTVEPFHNKGIVTYTNTKTAAARDDITVKAEVTGIPYQEEGFGCPVDTTGEKTFTDGEYESTITMEGTAGDEFWIED